MNEAELLFTEILNCSRQDLYLNRSRLLEKKESLIVSRFLRQRIAGWPLQYMLGKTEFMGLEFRVSQEVFIPRPETEILVEAAIEELKVRRLENISLLDIGTGCGCIAISLAKLLPIERVTATDKSYDALKCAKENAKLNKVKINFLECNLFPPLSNGHYDLIVSNPPYIPTAEIDLLQREVRREPRIALNGGNDGLDFYRTIIRDAAYYLCENGSLIFEMGLGQRKAIEDMAVKSGNFYLNRVLYDYNKIERIIVLKKTGASYG